LALFWAIPAVVLAFVYLVLALVMSPLLVPYLVIHRLRGRDAANRFAQAVVALLVVLVCGYQIATWVVDPVSFYWPLN
jgi:hypothetical protein